jgi:hypothetical protein
MILDKLCRVIYEFDNNDLHGISTKPFDEIVESYKKADDITKEKILDHVDRITKEKLLSMKEGGLL